MDRGRRRRRRACHGCAARQGGPPAIAQPPVARLPSPRTAAGARRCSKKAKSTHALTLCTWRGCHRRRGTWSPCRPRSARPPGHCRCRSACTRPSRFGTPCSLPGGSPGTCRSCQRMIPPPPRPAMIKGASRGGCGRCRAGMGAPGAPAGRARVPPLGRGALGGAVHARMPGACPRTRIHRRTHKPSIHLPIEVAGEADIGAAIARRAARVGAAGGKGEARGAGAGGSAAGAAAGSGGAEPGRAARADAARSTARCLFSPFPPPSTPPSPLTSGRMCRWRPGRARSSTRGRRRPGRRSACRRPGPPSRARRCRTRRRTGAQGWPRTRLGPQGRRPGLQPLRAGGRGEGARNVGQAAQLAARRQLLQGWGRQRGKLLQVGGCGANSTAMPCGCSPLCLRQAGRGCKARTWTGTAAQRAAGGSSAAAPPASP